MSAWERVAHTSERLREAMTLRNMTQADLVRETGLNRGTISRYLSGAYEPKQAAITKLAAVLDVASMWLWGYNVAIDRPAEQKKNDNLVEVIAKLRSDAEFYSMVCILAKLSTEQRQSLSSMLSAFAKE